MPRRSAISRALRPFQEFAHTGALGGVALLAATVAAFVWANSPFSESYFHLWETEIAIGPASAPLQWSVHHVINDGLMTVFFLLVGLEIKRELLVGELASRRQALLPIAAAVGGMMVPGLVYAALNAGGAGSAGWAIPMATDIAFALGILALAGSRVPLSLKVFLTALAIVDDLGAVIVIAIFYTHSLVLPALGAAAVLVGVLILMNRLTVASLLPYLATGALLWVAMLASGLHATIAGVVLAFTIPAKTRVNAAEYSAQARALLDDFDRTETGDLLVLTSKGQQEAVHRLDVASDAVLGPLLRLEQALHGAVAFVVVPLFAFANAGVQLSGATNLLTNATAVGVTLGLVVGKPVGITAFSWLAVRFWGASLPTGVTLRHLHAVSWIAGIGFTMSLFVSGLAFADAALLTAAKVGILSGSIVAGAVGFVLLRRLAQPGAAETARVD
jgi:NhaA family Na+:H+ antiporter